VGQGDLLGQAKQLGLPAGQDVGTGGSMALHRVELRRCQRTGLEQDGVGDADLADVVQRSRLAEQAGLARGQAQVPREPVRGDAHADGVLGGDVVAVLTHQREPLHQPGVGELELLGAGLHLLLQPLVVLLQAHVEHPCREQVGYAQRSLDHVDGLVQEVVSAEGQGRLPGAGRGVGGDHELGNEVRARDSDRQPSQHLEAIQVRHVQVEHDQVRSEVVEVVQHPPRVGGRHDVPVPLADQDTVDQVEVRLFVVHDDDPRPGVCGRRHRLPGIHAADPVRAAGRGTGGRNSRACRWAKKPATSSGLVR